MIDGPAEEASVVEKKTAACAIRAPRFISQWALNAYRM
jgi:hypothetical protein